MTGKQKSDASYLNINYRENIILIFYSEVPGTR